MRYLGVIDYRRARAPITRHAHPSMNDCYRDRSVRDAAQLRDLIARQVGDR